MPFNSAAIVRALGLCLDLITLKEDHLVWLNDMTQGQSGFPKMYFSKTVFF